VPAELTNVARRLNGHAQFTINGTPGRQYEVLASTNLAAWESLATLLATSNGVQFTDTNSAAISRRFYRARTLP